MSVTIKMIADAVGLSIQTVSRVLNGQGERHKAVTCARVRDAAQRLGYRPNASARAVRAGRFGCVALVAPSDRGSYMPQELLEHISGELAATGTHLAYAMLTHGDAANGEVVPKFLSERMVDGLLVNYHYAIPTGLLDQIRASGIPFVWLNEPMEIDAVRPDDFAAGREAADTLLDLGHERVVFVDYSHHPDGVTGKRPELAEHYSASARYEGYAAAMRSHGFEPRCDAEAWGEAGFDRIMKATELLSGPDRPTAVVTYSQMSSIAVMQAAGTLGLAPGRDLSIVSIDDEGSVGLSLGVDTMVVPWGEVGRAAVDMLMKKIERPRKSMATRVIAFRRHEGRTVGAPA